MCGRLVLTSSIKEKIRDLFDTFSAESWLPPRFNITPGQSILAVCNDHPAALTWLTWGFQQQHASRSALINARAETVHEKPTFREAFQQRRCLVFASGFYEWHRDPSQSRAQPYYFRHAHDEALVMAGLWQPGCSAQAAVEGLVITTEANQLMHPIHHRMPVLFTPESAHMWLNPATHPETLRAILQPFPSDQLACHPVSDRVNRASSEGPELIQPVPIYEQPGLF